MIPYSLGFVTVGVSNLEAIKKFYAEVFEWQPMPKYKDIAIYEMKGFKLAFYRNNDLAEDAGVQLSDDAAAELTERSYKGFTLAVNLGSREQVDKAFARFQRLGVKIKVAPQEVFWGGYRGYISDIENNLWEIVYNPFLEGTDDKK